MNAKEKRFCTLQEKDAVADMRAAAREVLAAYAAALAERLPCGLRAELVCLFAGAAEDIGILLRTGEEEECTLSDFAAQKKQAEREAREEG